MKESFWSAVGWYAGGILIGGILVIATEPMIRVRCVYYTGKVFRTIAEYSGKVGIASEATYYRMMDEAKL